MSIEKVLKEYLNHFPDDKTGLELIKKSASFAEEAHKNQKRANGEEYFIHLLETAYRLAKWKLDADSISAGFLHDTIEDCGVTKEELEKTFGSDITFLVEGVTKISNLKYKEGEAGIESLRKMILAISHDLRVIFVKLADRLHNMQTLNFVNPNKQKRIALETIEIYAPLAYRLGMQGVAGELEDLAFPYAYPDKHKWLNENIKETYEERMKYLSSVEPFIRKQLEKAQISSFSIDYRAKRLYSLYKKLMRFDMNLEQIYDLVALRIVVDSIEECYLVLGIIHQIWPPMPGKIKDYIALPKPNGYRSLHTTVFCLDNKPTEFQIRTKDMHEEAEHGSAAAWLYASQKHTDKRSQKSADSKEIYWIKQLKEWQNQFPGSKEFVEALKIDFFSDRIFVLTPKGKVIDLPVGSTPIDFAYKVHTDVGNSCIGAKVNNKLVPLDHKLQSGDVVEVITQKSKKPSKDWVSFVKTNYAKKKIKLSVSKTIALPKKIEYKMTCHGRVGLLKDISAIFSRNHMRIFSAQTMGTDPIITIKITTDSMDKEKAEGIMLKLKKVDGIKEINYKTN